MTITAICQAEPRHIHNGIDFGVMAWHKFHKGQRVRLSAHGLEFFKRNHRWVGRYDENVRGIVHSVNHWWPSAVVVVLSGTKTPQALHCDLLEAA